MICLKRCSKCGELKDELAFGKDKHTKDGLAYQCKSCVSERALAYYHNVVKKSPDYLSKRKEYNRKRREQRIKTLDDYKTPCVKCGESRPWVIAFHHVNPSEKSFNFAESFRDVSEKRLADEVDKCVCLCHNCHFDFHHKYGNLPERPIDALKEYLGENVSWEFTSKQNCGKRIVELLGGTE